MAVTVINSDVQEFASHCFYMRCVFRHLETLYETSDATDRQLMHDAAPFFFEDLNHILIEHVIQQICNITDPAEQKIKGGVVVNHTVAFFVGNSDFGAAAEKFARLEELQAAMKDFRKKLVPARNKLISHRDREAILAKVDLGVAPVEEWAAFWLHLQEFVEILHQRYLGGPFNINDALSDTDTLLKALRHGSYFDVLIRGPDKVLAKQCMQVVDRQALRHRAPK